MATGQLGTVVHYLRRLVVERASAEQSDCELLGRFHERQEADAFAALVRRHGPMVLSVCRRLLGDVHHAEDAFQATFLVLVRKSGSIRKRHSLSSWLHGVAYRIAVRARINTTQHRLQGLDDQEPAIHDADHTAWRDLRRVLDEELAELPEKYRHPLVLCYLEGKTNEEAARLLGWTKGTVSGRLARARDLLRSRLVRRGLTLAACGFAVLETQLSAQALVPFALQSSTIQLATLVAAGDFAAAGGILTLTEGVVNSMTLSKVKLAVAAVVVLSLFGGGAGVVGFQALAQDRSSEVGLRTDGRETKPEVVTPSSDGSVVIRTGEAALSLAVAPDGKVLAAGSDKGVRLWDVSTGAELRMLGENEQRIGAIAFSPDGRILVSGNSDGVIKFWDLATGKILTSIKSAQPVIESLAFAPDGRTLIGSSRPERVADSTVRIWEAPAGKELTQLEVHGERISHATFSADGKQIITGASDGLVRVWDAWSGKELRALQPQIKVRSLAVSPDGKTIAAVGGPEVVLLDLTTGKVLATLKLTGTAASAQPSIVFSPDGKLLAIARGAGAIELVDIPTGKLRLTLPVQAGPALPLVFTPDGQRLVSAGADGSIRLWKTDRAGEAVRAGELLARINNTGVPARLQTLVAELAKSQRSDDQIVEALCLATLSRFPTETERRFMSDQLAKQKDRRQEALSDIVWALINTKEFDAHVSELTKGGWGQRSIRDSGKGPQKQ